ncbi:MAG: thrombospondin type 3 repeat-containing protein [Verrucomicrobia bacterium]|nr:thrombospondin type 3 repeat-containing protein [Verrucomicrobiota bacterium]
MKTFDMFLRPHVVLPFRVSGSPEHIRGASDGRACFGFAESRPAKAGTTYVTTASSPAFRRFHTRLKSKIATLFALLALVPIHAFPPTPPHVLFGMIRDEMGNPLTVSGAELILETSTGKSINGTVVPGLEPGVNYKFAVPLDAAVRSDIYRRDALQVSVPFKMRVRIGTSDYLPIEMRGEFSKLGQSAQSTRLDLTLGEDANGNGLPDAWERAILAASGSKLTEVSPHDDSDGDGLSNLDEYIAGTNAFDSEDGFSLKVVEVNGSVPSLEFMSIQGHTYKVFGSSDLNDWAQTAFRIASDSTDAPDRQNYQANDSRVVRVLVHPAPEQPTMRFFRLRVE